MEMRRKKVASRKLGISPNAAYWGNSLGLSWNQNTHTHRNWVPHWIPIPFSSHNAHISPITQTTQKALSFVNSAFSSALWKVIVLGSPLPFISLLSRNLSTKPKSLCSSPGAVFQVHLLSLSFCEELQLFTLVCCNCLKLVFIIEFIRYPVLLLLNSRWVFDFVKWVYVKSGELLFVYISVDGVELCGRTKRLSSVKFWLV